MNKEEFNLSEKIEWKGCHPKPEGFIWVEDIKEFIKKDEDLICLLLNKTITRYEFWKLRDKLLGEELTKDVRRK